MEKTVNHWIRIYINKIENRILFKIKRGYYLEFVTSPAMELLGSTKSHITKDENGENISYFEITEVILIHLNDDYHQNSRVLHTFAPEKSFGQLLDVSPKKFVFSNIFDSEFSYIENWNIVYWSKC